MEWCGNTLPMQNPWKLDMNKFINMVDLFLIHSEEEFFGDGWPEGYAVEKILGAKYDRMNINE